MSAPSPISRLPIDVWIVIAEQLSLESKLNLRQMHRKVAFVAQKEIFATVCLDPTDRTPAYASGSSLYDLPADSTFIHQIQKLRHIVEHNMTSFVRTVILTDSDVLPDGVGPDDDFSEAVRLLMFLTHVECISIEDNTVELGEESLAAIYMFRVLFETIVKSSNNLLEIRQAGSVLQIDRLHDLLKEPCTSNHREAILKGFSKLETIILEDALYESDHDLMEQASGWRSVLQAGSRTLRNLTLMFEPDDNWCCPLKYFFPDRTFLYSTITDLTFSSDSNAEELTTIITSQMPQVRHLTLSSTSLSGSYEAFWKKLQSLQLESLCLDQVAFLDLSGSISDSNVTEVSDSLGLFLSTQSLLKEMHLEWHTSMEPLILSPELQASWLLDTAKSMAMHARTALRAIFVDFDIENMARQDLALSPSRTEQYAEHIATICKLPNLQRLTLDTIYNPEVNGYFDVNYDERVAEVFDDDRE